WSSVIGCLFAKIFPSASMVTVSVVCVSVPVVALGNTTWIACETISFAVTMKMISRTSVMSTSGVTLMPAIISSSFVFVTAMMRSPSALRSALQARLGLGEGFACRRGEARAFDVPLAQRRVLHHHVLAHALEMRQQHPRERVGVAQGRFDPPLK